MKYLRIIFFTVSILLSAGCVTFQQEIEDMYNQISQIQKTEAEIKARLEEVNESMAVLNKLVSTLQAGGYVKSFVPFNDETGKEAGYILTLSNGETVTIHNGKDGADGVLPNVGAKRGEDGLFYWTVDGKYVIGADGFPVRADGVTPRFEIRDNDWYVSYDNGKTWMNIGRATGNDGKDGEKGDNLFTKIDYAPGSNVVVFHLADGTSIVLPCYQAISIEFDIEDNVTAVAAGETIKVNYTLSYGDENTVVTASSDGNYKVKIVKNDNTSGTLLITCPGLYVDGHVNVMAFDGVGYSAISIINFYEKQILIGSQNVYYVATEGRSISIPVTYNADYYCEVSEGDESWLRLLKTKAEFREGTIELKVEKNDGDARVGYIYIYTANTDGTPYDVIEVHQASAYFTISPTSFIFKYAGGQGESVVYTSRGLSVNPSASWITAEIETQSNTDYKIKITAAENNGEGNRYGYVYVYSGDGLSHMATIDVAQLAFGNDGGANDQMNMVLVGKATAANDYTIYLPIRRNANSVDCVIDWGDGNEETVRYGHDPIQGSAVYHKYSTSGAAKEFTIVVSGEVYDLCSDAIPAGLRSGITKVKQWGNLGLRNMGNAFDGFTSLESLPADNLMAFREVTSFYRAFANCPRLVSIDKDLFKSAALATDFQYVFSNCYSLESIPEKLFAKAGKAEYFYGAFENCSSLKAVPANMFSGCEAAKNFSSVFRNCRDLTSISATAFSGCRNVETFSGAFDECANLESIPADLFSTCVSVTNFNEVFYRCEKLASIPADLFKNNTRVQTFRQAFYDNYALKSIPKGLFRNCVEAYDFFYTFGYCQQVTSIPVDIFDNLPRITDLQYTFAGLNNVKGESPYSTINGKKVHLYERINYPDYFVTPSSIQGCFSGCWQLADYDKIPQNWK